MKSLEHWPPINPFQWALGNDPAGNGIDGGYAIMLLTTTVVLVASAVIAFNRRDISS